MGGYKCPACGYYDYDGSYCWACGFKGKMRNYIKRLANTAKLYRGVCDE